ncbi:hypothetical protein ACIPUD_33830 [Bradyrhizobium sp. CAR08]
MARILAQVSFILFSSIAAITASDAAEGSRARIREVFAEAEYSNAASIVLDEILTAKEKRTCDFFGYRSQCTRRYLTPAERKRVVSAAAKAAPRALQVLKKRNYPPINGLTIVNAFRDTRDRDQKVVPVLLSSPYPGFIPFAAYDGTISPLYDALNHSFEYDSEVPKPQRDKYDAMTDGWFEGRLIYDANPENLKNISISLDRGRFEALLHQEFDFYGHDLFGDFADSRRVADGMKVVEFWESYVTFSRTADVRNCASTCSIAIELTSPEDHIRSIAHCSLISVAGVPGSPENCYTVYTSNGTSSYLRISFYPTALNGLDGIGGDEIACDPVPALIKADIDVLANAIADDLRKINQGNADPAYSVEIVKKGANRTILMATRYGLSAFFRDKTTYEISTTRVDLSLEETDRMTAAVALTAATSFTHSLNQDGYKLLQDADATAMRNGIIRLLSPSLKCKTSRGT